MFSYFDGGHSRLWNQVLVDAGACDGSFAAVGGQGASSGKPRREGRAGVLLGNLLDNQHFGHHLFATRGVFWSGAREDLRTLTTFCSSNPQINQEWELLPHTPARGATARILVPGFPVVSGLSEG